MFRRKKNSITVSLSDLEAGLLRKIIKEYRELIAAPDHADPVLKRLYPEASREDEAVSEEYREMALDQLEKEKLKNLETVERIVGEEGEWRATLSEEEQEAALVVLTDLRLSLGIRMDVTEEMMSRTIDPNDQKDWSLAVLHWLGALQESLVLAISP